jgi:hypothetical protein
MKPVATIDFLLPRQKRDVSLMMPDGRDMTARAAFDYVSPHVRMLDQILTEQISQEARGK